MLRRISIVTCAALCAPAAFASDMLGVEFFGNAWSVDSTGGGTPLGPSGASMLNGLSITDAGVVYAAGASGNLYTLDATTGQVVATDAIQLPDLRGLAWDEGTQTLLVVVQAAPATTTPDELWRIDPVTLNATLVGVTGMPGLQGLDVAPDGTIYAYDIGSGSGVGEGLVTLDPVTGVATDPFPSVGNGGGWQWVAVAPDGTVFVGRQDLYTVDLSTGAETLVGASGAPDLRGLDFLPGAASSTPYCFGDGSGATCPCGNVSPTPAGCANSTGAGASLASSGSTSVADDDLVLSGAGLVPNQPGLYFQGSSAIGGGSGIPFGDGLRCAGTNVIRLQTVTASPAGSSSTSVDVAATGGAAAGDVRYYQLWYRDPAGSPCGSGFNLTNGVEVSWTP